MPKTLLLVDDSITIQRVIELTFTHEDVRVVSVGDGGLALQWLESERPDIVLVDVDVPEVDGYSVAAYIRRTPRLAAVPVLLLAGAFEPIDEDRARSIGSDGVLVKPFEPQLLVTRVKDLLSRPQAMPGLSLRDAPRRHDNESAVVTPFPAPVAAPVSMPPAASVVAAVPSAAAMPSIGVPPVPLAAVQPRATEALEPPVHVATGGFQGVNLEPEPLEPPSQPLWDSGFVPVASPAPSARVPQPPPTPPPAPPSAPPKVSLVSAFSALLAAEQSTQPTVASSAAAPVTEATVEDAVRRVLVRMTDELVRRIVIETAERLIKEEIEKIKAIPE